MDMFLRAANENAAIALIRAGNLGGAEARLRNMLAEDPNDARALALMAHCRIAADDDKEALKIVRAAAEIDPDDELVRRTLAQALQRNRKYKEADDVAWSIAEENPDDSSALFRAAISRFNMKDYIGAKELFDEAEKHAGEEVHDLLNLAWLRLEQWNHATAEAMARKIVTIDPNQGDAFQILGECALATRQPLEAYELALEALRLSPGDKRIMRLLTRARARSNPLMRPFLPGVDWIVEMDRIGLVVVPVLMLVLGAAFGVSTLYDLARIDAGLPPAIVLSVGLGAALIYAAVSYVTAFSARLRIRSDLRKITLLPNF